MGWPSTLYDMAMKKTEAACLSAWRATLLGQGRSCAGDCGMGGTAVLSRGARTWVTEPTQG